MWKRIAAVAAAAAAVAAAAAAVAAAAVYVGRSTSLRIDDYPLRTKDTALLSLVNKQ